MVPLYKSSNKTEVGNYQPISILSPINKVFETLLHKRLIAYWKKFNLFTNHQFGFKKKHSTNLAIFDYIETILDLRDKNNIVSSVVYFPAASPFVVMCQVCFTIECVITSQSVISRISDL